MDKIESFRVNHLLLDKGLYVSRRDFNKEDITTFDLRMRKPNFEPVMDMPALHTIEHLGATFLRNSKRKNEIIYFGPMGCRTGCYLVMFGKLNSEDVYDLIIEMCDFIINFVGDIPGAKIEECGNFLEQNLSMAKFYIKEYLLALEKDKNFKYKQ